MEQSERCKVEENDDSGLNETDQAENKGQTATSVTDFYFPKAIKVYIVSYEHHVDCYKRADTGSGVAFITRDYVKAYVHAIKKNVEYIRSCVDIEGFLKCKFHFTESEKQDIVETYKNMCQEFIELSSHEEANMSENEEGDDEEEEYSPKIKRSSGNKSNGKSLKDESKDTLHHLCDVTISIITLRKSEFTLHPTYVVYRVSTHDLLTD